MKYLMTKMILVVLFVFTACSHQTELTTRSQPNQQVRDSTRAQPMPWLQESPTRWIRDFGTIHGDSAFPARPAFAENDSTGTRTNVFNLFHRWQFKPQITADRGSHFAELTDVCRGMLEIDFALTPEVWQVPENRTTYYRAVNQLIEKIGETLLADFGNVLEGNEKELFLRALKTLAWQESRWQHYLRIGDAFFVIVSGGSYNKLDDWGITQIARSSFKPEILLNRNYFENNTFCTISGSLYYGFMEYYFCYLEARENPDNGPRLFNRIIGAYNRYSSGYSSSCFALADDSGYRKYQINAMGGFKDHFILQPWTEKMGISAK
jgi:hypothetical protein